MLINRIVEEVGIRVKIQMFHNICTNRTKYNRRRQNTNRTKCKRTKYKHDRIQKNKIQGVSKKIGISDFTKFWQSILIEN